MADRDEPTGLDAMLAHCFGPAQNLEPSSGFVGAVMERVGQEALRTSYAPAPIAFPWGRALPLVCVALLALAVAMGLLLNFVFRTAAAAHGASVLPAMQGAAALVHPLALRAIDLPWGWLIVALAGALMPSAIAGLLAESWSRFETK